jgi:FKBP-type peptidyl-prolyl cis-trans isomerase
MAQTTVPAVQQPASTPPSFNYKKINPQLSYAFIIDKPGKIHPQEGDQISVNMQTAYENRPIYSTSIAYKGKPAVYGVTKPAFKGDIIEAITLMTPGDSMVCLADAEAIYKNSKVKKPDFMKPGGKMQYFIKLVSIKSKEQVQKEQNDAIMKQIKEQEVKQKAAAAKQLIVEDKTLKNYFASHHLSPVKTSSGLYYSINKEGDGEQVMPGDTLIVNYTGTLMNGTKFDSNEDTAFHNVFPYQFVVGRGMVIRGWDEGFTFLKTGSRATFYIPSPLAYGPQSRPGSPANPKGIPPNSILFFDVQLINCKHQVAVAKPAPVIDSLANPVKQ